MDNSRLTYAVEGLSKALKNMEKQLKGLNGTLMAIAQEYVKKSNNKGFSLVELMIVVGILGILTAIAIPNFQRFQARSRQSEAKAGLSAIHTAAHSFHAEWEVYAGALQPLGWVPENTEFRYAIGFHADLAGFCGMGGTAIALENTLGCGPAPGRVYRGNVDNPARTLTGGVATTSYGGIRGTAAALATHNITFVGNDAQATLIVATDTDANMNEGGITIASMLPTEVMTDVDSNSFTAGAIGNPLGYNGTLTAVHFDFWSIDHNKNLQTRLGGTLDGDL